MTALEQAREWVRDAIERTGSAAPGSWAEGRLAGLRDALGMMDAAEVTLKSKLPQPADFPYKIAD